LTVTKGPASGGTRVVIHGHNLADAIKVSFGKRVAEAANAPEILTNGSSTEVDALAPPGTAGTTVDVRVTTVESRVTHGSASPPSAGSRFTYTSSVASAPRHVRAHAHATSLVVRWKVPLSDGGKPITHYFLRAIAEPKVSGHKTPPTIGVLTVNGKTRSIRFTGLRGGWRYKVTVQAVTKRGRGLVGRPPHDHLIHAPA
jgi:hypothetical protein